MSSKNVLSNNSSSKKQCNQKKIKNKLFQPALRHRPAMTGVLRNIDNEDYKKTFLNSFCYTKDKDNKNSVLLTTANKNITNKKEHLFKIVDYNKAIKDNKIHKDKHNFNKNKDYSDNKVNNNNNKINNNNNNNKVNNNNNKVNNNNNNKDSNDSCDNDINHNDINHNIEVLESKIILLNDIINKFEETYINSYNGNNIKNELNIIKKYYNDGIEETKQKLNNSNISNTFKNKSFDCTSTRTSSNMLNNTIKTKKKDINKNKIVINKKKYDIKNIKTPIKYNKNKVITVSKKNVIKSKFNVVHMNNSVHYSKIYAKKKAKISHVKNNSIDTDSIKIYKNKNIPLILTENLIDEENQCKSARDYKNKQRYKINVNN